MGEDRNSEVKGFEKRPYTWKCPECGKLHAEAEVSIQNEWRHLTAFEEEGFPEEVWDPEDKDYPGEFYAGSVKILCESCHGEEDLEDYWTDLPSVNYQLRGELDKKTRALQRMEQASKMLSEALSWLMGEEGFRGASAETMLSVALEDQFRIKIEPPRTSSPSDNADFGRCWEMVKALPWVRASSRIIAQKSPFWSWLMDNWEELGSLYESDERGLLYRKIQEQKFPSRKLDEELREEP